MSNVIESFDSDFESIVILSENKQRDMLRCKLCGSSQIQNVEGSKHQHRCVLVKYNNNIYFTFDQTKFHFFSLLIFLDPITVVESHLKPFISNSSQKMITKESQALLA